MKGYADILVDFVVALKYEDLLGSVIEQTKSGMRGWIRTILPT